MKKLLSLAALAVITASSSLAAAGQYNNYGSDQDVNQKAVSDQEINKKIQDILSSSSFSQGFQGVSFDVNSGNVTLLGSVNSVSDKNKIESKVRSIEGVRTVSNKITVLKGNPGTYSESQLKSSEMKYPQDFASTAQDRQLNAKIRDTVSNTWFANNYDTLMISTTNGAVLITGSVNKMEDKQKVGDQIKAIDGVRSVNNQLTVNNR